jgi:hypothetical protein
MSTPVPLVDFLSPGFLSPGSFCMVKRKWVRFGIIQIEKKFGQVLEGFITPIIAGKAGCRGNALHQLQAFVDSHVKHVISQTYRAEDVEDLGDRDGS